MRTMILNSSLKVWMFAPLLIGCGTDNTSGTVVTFMPCTNGVLTTDSTGQLLCKPLPASMLNLPTCTVDQALTTDASGKFYCDSRNNETMASQMGLDTLTTVENKITMATSTRDILLAGTRTYYQGAGPATTGRIDDGKGNVGLAGAAKLCAAQYGGGAHMCTVYDMYLSAVTMGLSSNKFNPNMDLAKQWVYMQSWKNPANSTQEATAGLNDNCGAYTVGSTAQNWVGTAVAWAKVQYNSNYGLKFYSGSADAPCSQSLPIACCK